MKAFYNGVTKAMRFMIEVVVRGILMNKTEDEAHNLIQEIMPNNCQ